MSTPPSSPPPPNREAEAAQIGRVMICDPEHPHYREWGVFTGRMVSLLGKTMAEVKLEHCMHGTDACFVSAGQVRKEMTVMGTPARRKGRR